MIDRSEAVNNLRRDAQEDRTYAAAYRRYGPDWQHMVDKLTARAAQREKQARRLERIMAASFLERISWPPQEKKVRRFEGGMAQYSCRLVKIRFSKTIRM